jgi:hypothetical protein
MLGSISEQATAPEPHSAYVAVRTDRWYKGGLDCRSVTTSSARIGRIRKCLGGAHRVTNPILHQEGSTEARNVHADFCFDDFHLSAQIQDRDIRRCAPQLTFDGTLIVDMSKETPRPEKPSSMGLAAKWAGNPRILKRPSFA